MKKATMFLSTIVLMILLVFAFASPAYAAEDEGYEVFFTMGIVNPATLNWFEYQGVVFHFYEIECGSFVGYLETGANGRASFHDTTLRTHAPNWRWEIIASTLPDGFTTRRLTDEFNFTLQQRVEIGEIYVWSFLTVMGGVMLAPTSDDPEPTPSPTPTPPPTDPTPNLTTASTWAREGLARAISLNLVPTALQSNYTQPTTRGEFAALGVALYESVMGEITGRVSFTDTNDINVEKLAYLGVVDGVGGGRFAPDNQLTREQAAVLVTRLAEAIGHPFPTAAPTFADNARIASWARAGVGQAQAAGIMGGVGNNMFSPQGLYTREQSIITMLRLFDLVE